MASSRAPVYAGCSRGENGIVQAGLARVVSTAGVGWAGVLALAPLAPAATAAVIYMGASLVCHQRPDRSFHAWGAQLPVCARCAGIYAGAALVALAYLTGRWRPAARASRAWIRRALGAACLPTIVTLSVEWGGLGTTSNGARAGTGLVLGLVAAAVVIAELHWLPREAAGPLVQTR